MGVLNTRDTPRDTPPRNRSGHTLGHTLTLDRIAAGQSIGTRGGTHRDTPSQSHRDTRCPTEGDTRSQDQPPSVVSCQKCAAPRTLRGPFYDPRHLRCLTCGATWRGDAT